MTENNSAFRFGKPTLVGGEKVYKNMTKKLLETDPKEYAKTKAYYWMFMLQDNQAPVRWYKPTTKHTRVKFEYFKKEEQLESAVNDLRDYINQINKEFGFDFEISIEEEKEDEK